MKPAIICFAFSLLVGLTGCKHDHDKIGDAPRTESASSVAGWKDISTSGIALQFPADWKVMDMARDKYEKAADQVFGNDPKFAEVRSQASAAAKQGMFKLFAFETATIGSGFATNCNVMIQDAPAQETLEQAADLTVSQLGPVVTKGTQPKLQYLSLKSGRSAMIRSEITTANPSFPVLVSLAYLSLKGSKLVVVTFTVPGKDETHIQPIADQVMNTFHFTN
jgi:hypothetical protein